MNVHDKSSDFSSSLVFSLLLDNSLIQVVSVAFSFRQILQVLEWFPLGDLDFRWFLWSPENNISLRYLKN